MKDTYVMPTSSKISISLSQLIISNTMASNLV